MRDMSSSILPVLKHQKKRSQATKSGSSMLEPMDRAYRNNRPTSSKEAVHDAPEVVIGPWLAQQQQRPNSPYSMDETVVSGFQPLEFDEKGQPVSRRVSELPSEKAPKKCGIPRRYLLGVIILVFVVAAALGLGLGLGLGNKKKEDSSPS